MTKKYMIQTNANIAQEDKLVASEMKILSDHPGANVQKVLKTDDKEITVLEVEDPKIINGLASKEGVIVEECQTMSIFDVNIKESWFQKIVNFFSSLFFSIKTEDDSIHNISNDFLEIDLGRYRINGLDSIKYNINPNLWNITNIRANEVWKYGYTGEGIVIAVLDTGICAHKDLPNVLPGICTVGPGRPTNLIQDDHSHGCVSPNTLVHTNYCGIESIETLYNRIPLEDYDYQNPDGSNIKLKNVKEFGIKTYAMDIATGITKIEPIEFLHKIPVDSKIIEIILEGNIKLELTPWHPVYTKYALSHKKRKIEKKRADELLIGDRLAFCEGALSGHLIDDYPKVYGCDYCECTNCGHETKIKIIAKKPRCSNCKKTNVLKKRKKEYFFNDDLAYITGLVLTDGHIVHNRNYRVEISSNNIEILEEALKKINRLGFKGRIDYPKNKCERLLIDSKELVILLENIGIQSGCKTYTQTLPEIVGKSPYSSISSFIAGVIDGDGCINRLNNSNRITTASKKFAYQMAALLNSIGISCGVQPYKNYKFDKSNGKQLNKVKSEIYNCEFSCIPLEIANLLSHNEKKLRGQRQVQNKRVSRKIKSINKKQYNGYFYDFTVSNSHTYIANGHFVSNTHVSSTIAASNPQNTMASIYGVAPKCKILPIKVLGKDGFGDSSDIIEGLIYAKEQKVNVISMSLGGGGYSQIFDNALQDCINAGIIVVAATGNEAKEINYPAKYNNVIPVGSCNQYNKISYFSNYGPELSQGLVAPGEKIYGAGVHNDYAFKSGTSMATPAVSGAVALIKQRDKNATINEVKKSLSEGAIKFKGIDTNYQGNGKLDVPNVLIVFNRIKKEQKIPTEVAKPIIAAPEVKTNAKFYKQSKGDLIRNFQISLKELGLYNDKIDGVYGNNTANAVLNYTNGKQDFVGPIVYKNLTGQEWPDLFSRSLQITADFEGTGYTQIVGDFDSAILTWGIIGFTLKHLELIDILIEIYDKNPDFIKDSFKNKSEEIIKLINNYKTTKNPEPFFDWGRNCNTPEKNNDDVKPEYVNAFDILGRIPDVKQIQRIRAKSIYWDRALRWANDFQVHEELSLALCFDCAVQGFNSSGRQQVVAMTETARQEAIAKIQASTYTEAEKRKIIATANANSCNPKWRQDVWSRKSLFITGIEKSYVHKKAYELSKWGLEY